MSNLPGNPYADALTDYTDPRNSIEALATLAAAYEQRTANLIAIQRMGVTDMTDWAPVVIDAWSERAMEISVRLGYEPTK